MIYSFYDEKTGVFTGRRYSGKAVKENTPQGLAAIEGTHDRRTHRVDLDTGEVVPYQAPPDAQQQRDRAQARIATLERAQQRPSRELAIDPDNAEARRRIEAIDAEIAQLRTRVIQS